MSDSSQIKIWDPLVIFFHWSLVTAFIITFITEEDLLVLHSQAGYLIIILLSIRLIWGFIGSKHARFSDFLYSPKNIIQFLKDTVNFRAKRYLGHNPAGGAMVILLIVTLFITAIFGMLLYGTEQSGPFAQLFAQKNEFWREALEELHEFFANFSLFLVLTHIVGVMVESYLHKENLISAMLSGFKSKIKQK